LNPKIRGDEALASTPGRERVVLPIGEVLLPPLLVSLNGEEGCLKPLRMMPLAF
jgi:hypothetical protein